MNGEKDELYMYRLWKEEKKFLVKLVACSELTNVEILRCLGWWWLEECGLKAFKDQDTPN